MGPKSKKGPIKGPRTAPRTPRKPKPKPPPKSTPKSSKRGKKYLIVKGEKSVQTLAKMWEKRIIKENAIKMELLRGF